MNGCLVLFRGDLRILLLLFPSTIQITVVDIYYISFSLLIDQPNLANCFFQNGSTKPVMDVDPIDDVIDTENRGKDIEKDIVPGSQSIMNLVTNFTPFYPERLWLSQEVFCEYFPYHIVFDSYLRPLQTGLHIQRLLPTLQSTEADTLDSFFKIIHPQIDWKLSSMRKFINMQFVLETKRSVITQGWGKDRPMLQLRGKQQI